MAHFHSGKESLLHDLGLSLIALGQPVQGLIQRDEIQTATRIDRQIVGQRDPLGPAAGRWNAGLPDGAVGPGSGSVDRTRRA